ncbi:hypothetical protein [Hahella ganghwensis]|uniref:hypothetical protein n=1 Tax=Hahella ganghwensis TaxID=286420 RepID=UPI0003696BD8|nr:hypothetical protein [Hahella ganghwensis]
MENIGGITSLGGDKFQINNQVMSLAELIMLLEIERANNLEQQLAAELQSMAALNSLLKEANALLSIARVEKGKLEGDGESQMPSELKEFMKDHDIQQGKGKGDSNSDFKQSTEEWETTIENLKAFIDGLNSRSQLEMIRISSLMKKRDESLTLPSNTNSNIHQTNQGIIGKF